MPYNTHAMHDVGRVTVTPVRDDDGQLVIEVKTHDAHSAKPLDCFKFYPDFEAESDIELVVKPEADR